MKSFLIFSTLFLFLPNNAIAAHRLAFSLYGTGGYRSVGWLPVGTTIDSSYSNTQVSVSGRLSMGFWIEGGFSSDFYSFLPGYELRLGVAPYRSVNTGIGPFIRYASDYFLDDGGHRWESIILGVQWDRHFFDVDRSRFAGAVGYGLGKCSPTRGLSCESIVPGPSLRLEWFLKSGFSFGTDLSFPQTTIMLQLGYSFEKFLF